MTDGLENDNGTGTLNESDSFSQKSVVETNVECDMLNQIFATSCSRNKTVKYFEQKTSESL